jgi:hypothetical protein
VKRSLPLALSALVLLLLLLLAASAQAALPDGRAIAVATSVSPDVHLFAEPVVVRVRVIVDPSQFDPARLRVQTSFAPYEVVGKIKRSQRTIGDVVELVDMAILRCLTADCLAPRYQTVLGEQESGRPERFTYRFAPAAVLYAHPNGRTELLLQRPFPTLEVVSRVNTAQVQAVDPLAQPGLGDPSVASAYTASIDPPSPTYRLPARVLAGGALALAGLLLLFPLWVLGRVIVSRWRARRRDRELSRIDRALLLVEWASRTDDGGQDRRRALEALADVLEERGAEPLAQAARTSAWDEEVPDAVRARDLASEARGALGGRDWSR